MNEPDTPLVFYFLLTHPNRMEMELIPATAQKINFLPLSNLLKTGNLAQSPSRENTGWESLVVWKRKT
jgi:hypothetical protein